MNIGYARVSTAEQNLTLQTDALSAVECERIFVETASGAQRDRPELKRALDYMRPGDTLVVWKLDRLARSMRQLIDTVEQSQGFCSLTEAISFGWSLTPKPAMIRQATGWLHGPSPSRGDGLYPFLEKLAGLRPPKAYHQVRVGR